MRATAWTLWIRINKKVPKKIWKMDRYFPRVNRGAKEAYGWKRRDIRGFLKMTKICMHAEALERPRKVSKFSIPFKAPDLNNASMWIFIFSEIGIGQQSCRPRKGQNRNRFRNLLRDGNAWIDRQGVCYRNIKSDWSDDCRKMWTYHNENVGLTSRNRKRCYDTDQLSDPWHAEISRITHLKTP